MANVLKSTKLVSNMDLIKVKQIEDIKSKTALILENRKNVNYLIDFLSKLNQINETYNEDNCSQLMVDTIIRSLTKIFVRFIHNKEMVINSDETEANKTYKNWLKDVYNQSIDAMIEVLDNNCYTKSSQKLSLNCLIKFVSEEGKYPLIVSHIESKETFPDQLLTRICNQLLSQQNNKTELIHTFGDYLAFDDVIHYTLRALQQILELKSIAENNNSNEEVFVRNAFEMISMIKLKTPEDLIPRQKKLKRKVSKTRNKSDSIVETKTENIILCVPTQPNQKCFKINYERDADLFSSVWIAFLRLKLSVDLYKKVLVMMDKHIMAHFRNPLTLTDFLIESYNIGGVVSLLSLSSLYILIQKCNLDYPKFFEKLYALLSPGIVYVKYRPRFLFWCDVFLTSSHISAHIVASFVKRLSRIALTASCDALLILLPFIGNLLVRHPSLITMIRSTKSQTLDCDPFDNSITDPQNTNAIDSSLWEIKTLQSHFHPQVAKTAAFINEELPNREWDLSLLLETSFEDIIESSLKKMSEESELTFDDKNSAQLMAILSKN